MSGFGSGSGTGVGANCMRSPGIPGEFGEGLPDAGVVPLTHERTGHLFGRGTVWVLVWDEGGSCDPRAVLGNGLEKRAFLLTLERTGIVTPR